MIFVDTNVFIHHVGGRHRLRDEARAFMFRVLQGGQVLVTSAEVLQEILHFYHRTRRVSKMDEAFDLVDRIVSDVWPVERADVERARSLAQRYPGLEARDLVHLAGCIRRKAGDLFTFDRGLAAAWEAQQR